jgi:hypothetical protein
MEFGSERNDIQHKTENSYLDFHKSEQGVSSSDADLGKYNAGSALNDSEVEAEPDMGVYDEDRTDSFRQAFDMFAGQGA